MALKPILIRLPEAQVDWLDSQPESRAEILRFLVLKEMHASDQTLKGLAYCRAGRPSKTDI